MPLEWPNRIENAPERESGAHANGPEPMHLGGSATDDALRRAGTSGCVGKQPYGAIKEP